MSPKTKSKQETKIALLEAGTELMFEKGYTNTGISEILKKVNVPKGSFYYYFDSKEDFAVEIINHFDCFYRSEILSVLQDESLTPLRRLKAYCKNGKEMFMSADCKKGCIIGNLSQEMASQSDCLREKLYQVVSAWRDEFAICIKAGQDTGEIKDDFLAEEIAELFMSGWQGAVMRAKTTRDSRPLDIFMELIFDGFLKK